MRENSNNQSNQQGNEKGQFKKNKNELAALWKKQTKNGHNCLSGQFTVAELREKVMAMGKGVDRIGISVFANSYKKEGTRQPDYKMYINPIPSNVNNNYQQKQQSQQSQQVQQNQMNQNNNEVEYQEFDNQF